MSKVILCAGKKAVRPYTLNTSGVNVYTIEELCYCLRAQLDMLDEGMIDREMALFIRDELGFEERGDLLEQLVLTKADLKSRLVVIMCTGDYYDEGEIRKICDELDELAGMSAAGRRKRRADRYMQGGYYKDALKEYRGIISSVEGSTLSAQDYGNIMHNIGVINVRSARYDVAAEMFLEAYERNESRESLKCYFYALKLGHREGDYMKEATRLLDNGELIKKIEEDIENATARIETAGEFGQLDRLKVLYQQGRTSEFDRLSDEMITVLKSGYRSAVTE